MAFFTVNLFGDAVKPSKDRLFILAASLLSLIIMPAEANAATVHIAASISGDAVIVDANGDIGIDCPGGSMSINTPVGSYNSLYGPGGSYFTSHYSFHAEFSVCDFRNGENAFTASVSGCGKKATDESVVNIQINPSVTIEEPRGIVSPLGRE